MDVGHRVCSFHRCEANKEKNAPKDDRVLRIAMMSMTRRDQLQTVAWRDLVALTPLEKTWELSLGLPWLFLSLWSYGHGCWAVGLAGSFYLFLTGLRQSHNAQHYALGLPR